MTTSRSTELSIHGRGSAAAARAAGGGGMNHIGLGRGSRRLEPEPEPEPGQHDRRKGPETLSARPANPPAISLHTAVFREGEISRVAVDDAASRCHHAPMRAGLARAAPPRSSITPGKGGKHGNRPIQSVRGVGAPAAFAASCPVVPDDVRWSGPRYRFTGAALWQQSSSLSAPPLSPRHMRAPTSGTSFLVFLFYFAMPRACVA